MRTALVSLIFVLGAITAPTVARACEYDDLPYATTTVTGTSDQANHQSSLSSTTEGGATTTTTCPAGDPSDNNGG